MNSLATVREGWKEVSAESLRLLRALTIAEGIAQYLALCEEFEPWLRQTEPQFRAERDESLRTLQARLSAIERQAGQRMDNLIATLDELQRRLEAEGLPSVVIGGLAVGVWGEPRLTRDVDLKVMAGREERARVLDILADLTPLNADPDEALRRNGIAFFQTPGGVRVDIMLADNLFDETALGRAQRLELAPGVFIRVCTAEDLIIYKSLSLRPRDHLDVETIIRRQGDRLDDAYVLGWLRQFEAALDDSTLVTAYRRQRGI